MGSFPVRREELSRIRKKDGSTTIETINLIRYISERESQMTDKLNPAPLAYKNEPFLSSPDGRILRILAEYQEPLARFRREQIQDTVVFFGSARFQGGDAARNNLTTVEKNDAQVPSLQHENSLKRARAAVDM